MYTPISTRAATTYRRVSVESEITGADPHRLVDMLYDAVLQQLRLGHAAMQRGDIAGKSDAMAKAMRIIDEGLKSGLNPAGGELTVRLKAVYEYSIKRLTLANLRNDVAAVSEVIDLIAPLAESWKSIRAAAVKGA